MSTKIKLYKLGKCTKSLWHLTIEAEVADINKGNSSVRMQLHTWLISPKIHILVEVPICTCVEILAYIIPILSTKGLPDSLQGIVILDIIRSLRKHDRHIGFSHLIIFNDKGLIFIRNNFLVLSKQLIVLRIHLV